MYCRRIPPIKRLKNVTIFIFVVISFITFTKYNLSQKTQNVPIKMTSNPLTLDSVIVYRAYFEKLENGNSRIQVLASAQCKSVDNLQMRLGSLNSKFVNLTIEPIERKCPWYFAPKCKWNSFRIDAKLNPSDVPQFIFLSKPGSEPIPIKVHKTLPKKSSLAVCVPPMYWINDPLKVGLFIETWKTKIGATHFYFYFHSVSKAVKAVLDHYANENILTIIDWPVLPKSENVDPNTSQYRFGHSIAHNDCKFRSDYRFVALVDIDEFLLINEPKNNSMTTFEYIKNVMKTHPLAGSFTFKHTGLHFPSWPIDGTPLQRVDYKFLSNALTSHTTGPQKTIFLTDRADVINTHYIMKHFKKYSSVIIRNEDAQLFHYRVNWMNDTVENTTAATMFDGFQYKIQKSLNLLFSTIGTKLGKPLTVNATVATKVNECIHNWKKVGCKTPYHMCRGEIGILDDWVFSQGTSKTYTIL